MIMEWDGRRLVENCRVQIGRIRPRLVLGLVWKMGRILWEKQKQADKREGKLKFEQFMKSTGGGHWSVVTGRRCSRIDIYFMVGLVSSRSFMLQFSNNKNVKLNLKKNKFKNEKNQFAGFVISDS